MAFLHTNKLSERETKNTIVFTITTKKKKNKALGINLTREVKDPYSKNYRPLKKEIKEDTNNCVCGLEELTS